jgi:hypothetical protein
MKTPERIWINPVRLDLPIGKTSGLWLERLAGKFDTEYIRASLLKDDKWLADNGLVREANIFICDKCGDTGVAHEFRGTFNHAIDCSCITNPLSIYSIKKEGGQ